MVSPASTLSKSALCQTRIGRSRGSAHEWVGISWIDTGHRDSKDTNTHNGMDVLWPFRVTATARRAAAAVDALEPVLAEC